MNRWCAAIVCCIASVAVAQPAALTRVDDGDPIVRAYEAESLTSVGDEVAAMEDELATGGTAATLSGAGAGLQFEIERLPVGVYQVYVCAKGSPAVIAMRLGEKVVRADVRPRGDGLYDYVAKLPFHADEERAYSGRIEIVEGDGTLIIDRLELRSALGDLFFEAIKTERSLTDNESLRTMRAEAAQQGTLPTPLRPQPLPLDQREARDDELWREADVATASDLARRYLLIGDLSAAADGAIVLAALAYRYPTIDAPEDAQVDAIVRAYDRLFPYINGNAELAARIGRFIPWITTPGDAVRLFDTYLVQRAAEDARQDRIDAGVLSLAADVIGEASLAEVYRQAHRERATPASAAPAIDEIATLPTENGRMSTDDKGLVELHLTGMSELDQPAVKVSLAHAQYEARIKQIDYDAQVIVLDRTLPRGLIEQTPVAVATPRGPWVSRVRQVDTVTLELKRPTRLLTVTPAAVTPTSNIRLTDLSPAHRDALENFRGCAVRDAKGRVMGRGSLTVGGRYYFTGRPAAMRHLAQLDANLVNTQVQVRSAADSATVNVSAVRDDGYVLYTTRPDVDLGDGTRTIIHGDRQWHADVFGNTYHLVGDIRAEANGPLTLEAINVGDTLTCPGWLHVKRIADDERGIFEIRGNTACTLTLPGRRVSLSHDNGETWRRIDKRTRWGKTQFEITADDLTPNGIVWIRMQ